MTREHGDPPGSPGLDGGQRRPAGKFGDVLAKVKRQLESAGRTIAEAGVRTRAMERKLRAVAQLPGDEAGRVLDLPASGEPAADLESDPDDEVACGEPSLSDEPDVVTGVDDSHAPARPDTQGAPPGGTPAGVHWGGMAPSATAPTTRSVSARHRVATVGAAALVAFLAILAAAIVASAYLSEPAFAGANPSTAAIRAKLYDAAVAHDVPPKILYAIAFQESTWRQFDAHGDPLIGYDGLGIGIMQVTSYDLFHFDVDRLKTDIDYNIACGVQILLEKRTWTPLIGDGDGRCYENWFYAVWAYNAWTARNPYPYKVWAHVAAGPEGWWTGQPVTAVPKSALVDGLGAAIPTPQPAHYWSPTPLPKPTLSMPRAPATVAAGARFAVTGTLSPAHPAGAHSVEIRCYRASGSAWVLKRTIAATNEDGGAVTRYVARFAFGKTGRWRLRAYAPADAEHAAVTSAPRALTVR